MKQIFDVNGMSCSACSSGVERVVGRLAGVSSVEVNLLGKSMTCQFDEGVTTEEDIINAVTKAGFSAVARKEEERKEEKVETLILENEKYTPLGMRLGISIGFLVILMYVAMGPMIGISLPEWLRGEESLLTNGLLQLVLSLPIMYVNRKFFFVGFRALLQRMPNMDSLVAVGSSAAFIYGVISLFSLSYTMGRGESIASSSFVNSLYFESATMILTLVTVGKLLEERSKKKTTGAVEGLMKLAPKEATVIKDGKKKVIPVDNILVGDIIEIKPGESIPVDGRIIEGSTTLDESALTGESLPVVKQIGDLVISSSINKNGVIKMKAVKVGENTTLAQIIKLVEEAGASKAPISRIADKVAGVFVPVVMTIAFLVTILWLVTGKPLSFALSLGISVLVISCPCALGLATPVAITVATGKCAREGILIKSAEALEELSKVDTVVFDKTGTLTEGKPQVTHVVPIGMTEKQLLQVALGLEEKSEHPLGESILNYAKEKNIEALPINNFQNIPGKGIEGRNGTDKYYGGNEKFVKSIDESVEIPSEKVEKYINEGHTPMYFMKEDQFIGIIFAKDEPKMSTRDAVRKITNRGIKTIMLTGDNHQTANKIGSELGIDDVVAEVLPGDKEKHIRKLMEEGHVVAMVGDGINDSPALTKASVGLAIGNGTDIAIESADIVLTKGDLQDVERGLEYSGLTMKNIKQNLFWAFFYNVLGIPVAAGALFPIWGITLSPMIAAACMSISSIFVTTNALRLYRK